MLVEGPEADDNTAAGLTAQLALPGATENVPVQPTQLCAGPVIFITGFTVTLIMLLPLQFFFNGLL